MFQLHSIHVEKNAENQFNAYNLVKIFYSINRKHLITKLLSDDLEDMLLIFPIKLAINHMVLNASNFDALSGEIW